MADGTVGVLQATSPDRLIDNDTGTVAGQTVYRQRVWDTGPIGTWSYAAGISGSEAITGRVLAITAITGGTPGSFTINGGDTITVPANASLAIEPRGVLVDPTIVFTDTEAYFVEFVS